MSASSSSGSRLVLKIVPRFGPLQARVRCSQEPRASVPRILWSVSHNPGCFGPQPALRFPLRIIPQWVLRRVPCDGYHYSVWGRNQGVSLKMFNDCKDEKKKYKTKAIMIIQAEWLCRPIGCTGSMAMKGARSCFARVLSLRIVAG